MNAARALRQTVPQVLQIASLRSQRELIHANLRDVEFAEIQN